MKRIVFVIALLAAGAGWAQGNPPPAPPASGAMGGHPPGPPPEAIQACSGKAAGSACSFSGRQGGMMSGTCAAAPAMGSGTTTSSALACRPDRGGPPPGAGK
jgi:hypothetical protein